VSPVIQEARLGADRYQTVTNLNKLKRHYDGLQKIAGVFRHYEGSKKIAGNLVIL
jgi:hypothetical protein